MMNFRFLILLSSVIFLFSCDNEVILLEDAGPVPIVYGLYNASENEQFVSITKSFQFGDEGGALAAAQQEDSLYYGRDEIVAYAENSRTADRVTMTRVNLADQGIEKVAGVFPSNPNFFYTYNSGGLNTNPGDTVNLRIEKNGEIIAAGAAPVLPTLEFIGVRPPLDFYPFSSETPYSFSWTKDFNTPEGLEIGTYELGFDIFVTETGPNGVQDLKLYWAAGTELDGGSDVFRGRLGGFYDFLNGALEDRLDGFSYSIPAVRLVITGGDESFNAYRELILANRGITSTGELPPFSNVEGGIGLYGGVTQLRQTSDAGFTPDAADALKDRCPTIDFGL